MRGNLNPFPLSDKFIESTGMRGRKFDLLSFRASRNLSLECDDFNYKAINTTHTYTACSGGTATAWAVQAAAGGWIMGDTGVTTACAALQLYRPTKYWTGSAKAGMAVLWKSDVVEGVTVEIGFVDALPAINTTVINNATTPTFNTSVDVAMFLYQHTGNATAAPNRVGLYAANSSAATAQKSVVTIGAVGGAPGPAAATEHFVAIELIGTTVYCWIGDGGVPLKLTSAITAANGVIPFISVKGANSTAKQVSIDAIWTWSGRLG